MSSEVRRPQGLTADEDQIISHLHSVFLGYRASVTRKQLRNILLYSDGFFIVRGQGVDVRSKHIGGGIYHIWYEARK